MPFYNNKDFLDKRYLLNNDIDINAMMSSVTGETIDGTFDTLQNERNDVDVTTLGWDTFTNHTVFAQNIVKEFKTGKFFKSSQMFLRQIKCPSNSGYIDIKFLTTAFKTTQGLVELPIHTILKIGGIYDFYYYNDYEKDDKIDFDIINGLKTKNGYDLLDDPIIKNKHYGTYVYDDKNLILATAPFVKPITPRHIDDVFSNGTDSFSKTDISKNYRENYYDYNLNTYIPLNNNIASHIPFTGYGVLNNYMNAMSYFFFGEGLDGQKDENTNLNDNGVPYHIIGNFKGNLKTFKTYNDTQLNFLASYNSFGTTVQHDLNGIKNTLDTLTRSITLDTNFVFSKDPKKTEFFLILSKIKANYLGGYIATDSFYLLIKDLCTVNNLKAKNDGKDLSDFAALLIHLLFYPDGGEKDSRRPNKTLRVLSLYDVDPNSFMPVITYDTNIFLQLADFLKNIVNELAEKQHEQVAYLLLSLWSKEFNTEKSSKLSAIDKLGTYVVYPSCGGEIGIKELFSNKNYTYHKTNNVSAFVESNDLLNPYITGLTKSSFTTYSDINNDLLDALNFDYKIFYENLPNNVAINTTYSEFLDQKALASTLKYSEKGTIPNSVTDNDNFFLPKYDQSPYNTGLTTLNITKPMVTSNLDRYDDLYIIANTTNPDGIEGLNFNNRTIVNNTSKLFWFDQARNIFPNKGTFRSKKGEHLKDIKVYDYFENEQYGYGDNVKELYEWGDPLVDELRIFDYSRFQKDTSLYLTYSKEFIDGIVDIFGFDKLEDFRSLFKNFADTSTKNYFTEAFNTFNFQSLIKHTNIFGYSNLPETLTLDKAYTRDEISAFLCGYSGYFIEFASKNDVSKIINYSLTIGQENKAKAVIDEFMNAKITINNYSTTGSLYVDNTGDNPEGLRLNSNIFNPIIMYASETRTADSIINKLDYRLLFRTLLFGDQPVSAYDVKTIPGDYYTLVEKYLNNISIFGVEPTLEKTLLPELVRTFFITLNIEITEGNLKLLLPYIKNYIYNLINKNTFYKYVNNIREDGSGRPGYYNATIFPSAEGAVNKKYDFILDDYIITEKVVNGVLTKVAEQKYLYNTFDELKAVEKLKEFIDYTNKNILTKQIESFNTGLKRFAELSKSKVDGLARLADSGNLDEYNEELTKSKIEARTGTYYRIKTLYDRSVSFNDIDLNDQRLIKKTSKDLAKISVNDILNYPLFFNFNVETDDTDYENCVDKKLTADVNDGKLKDLYDYAMVIDRGNNPYGTKVLANIDALKKVIAEDLKNATQVDNTLRSKSMWSVLSTLASDHEFLLLPLTSYVNLNGAIKDSEDPFEVAHDMFGVFNNLEMFDSNPAFIFQLGSLTSNVSAGNKQKRNNLSEFDLSNTFCLDIETSQLGTNNQGIILDEGIPNDILNSNVSSFIVDFGNKNQNMFQNIQLSTDEFANTEESIFTQVNLASTENVAQLSSGKLFTAMENRSYSCTVTSLGNAAIQPLTYFYIKNVPLFYGTYWITNVSHKITPNTMTTTFKGVRQPISKKPTANTSILAQLLKTAKINAESTGYVDPNNRVPTPTDGYVYAYNNRTSVAGGTDSGFALFSQATTANSGVYVNYSGQWIAASYLNLMTNGDQNNKLLIKALIAYLYNNASLLAGNQEPAEAVKYFADIVLYDMFVKLGMGRSISNLLSTYPTSGNQYEQMLLEFSQKPLAEVAAYLKHDQPLKGIKTTLIATKTGNVIGNDGAGTVTGVTVSYPKDIEIPSSKSENSKSDFIGASYWVSDKPANNFQELQGFSRYDLTNTVFKTTGSIFPDGNHNGSIEETFTALQILPNTGGLSSRWSINVNPKLYIENGDAIFVDVYTPYRTPDGYPTKILNGISQYKLIETIGDYKAWLNTNLTQNDKDRITTAYNNGSDIVLLPFDTSKITKGKVGEKYFVVLRYGKAPFVPKTHIDARLKYNRSIGINNSGNSPILNSNNFFANIDTKPAVVLGFGTVSGQTSPLSGEFVYGASYGDPYLPAGRGTDETTYQADVLGAISNGKSYISFIAISPEDQLKATEAKDRTIKSYINRSVLGSEQTLQDWTIVNKAITSDQIYKPPVRRFADGTKTKISGWVDPLKQMVVTSKYGMRTIDGETRMHQGVDLSASVGTSVYSVLPGKVVFVGPCDPGGYGRAVIVAHSDKNVSTLYGHISAEKVSVGATVSAGDIIALSGDEGSAKKGGAHLHFEVAEGIATDYTSFIGLKKVDPAGYLAYSSAGPDKKTINSAETEANILEIKQYLQARGWSKYEVAGVLGNMYIETITTFNPYSTNAKDFNGYPSLGLIQWNGRYIAGGTKDVEKGFDVIGRTVVAQLNYMVEGPTKRTTDQFRAQLKKEIQQNFTVATSNVGGLTPDELQAYVAAYVFAWKTEVCFNCNLGWDKYHSEESNTAPYKRSVNAVKFLKRMNDTNDKLKW